MTSVNKQPHSRPSMSSFVSVFSFVFLLAACSPTVKVAPPEKPITINLNVKIDHEVRIKVDKELEETIFSEDSDLF